jgi:predicted esterase
MIERTMETTTHGRYLIVPPASHGPAPALVGFHGYAELAEAQLDRMRAIQGAGRWLLLAIQGLNRFYQRRTNEVIAGWMTRQDRELAIQDNIRYVASVIDELRREWRVAPAVVYAGFSQGVAMAFRAAASIPGPVAGVIAAGGDVPPEIEAPALRRIGRVLLCHGRADQWYTTDIFERDLGRLRDAGVEVHAVEFDGGHEWSAGVLDAASAFLATVLERVARQTEDAEGTEGTEENQPQRH